MRIRTLSISDQARHACNPFQSPRHKSRRTTPVLPSSPPPPPPPAEYFYIICIVCDPNKLNWNWSHVGRLLGCTYYHNIYCQVRGHPSGGHRCSRFHGPLLQRGCRAVTACQSFTFPFYELFFFRSRSCVSAHEFTECASPIIIFILSCIQELLQTLILYYTTTCVIYYSFYNRIYIVMYYV